MTEWKHSVPDIYAAGDAVPGKKHYVTGNDALISLAGPANKQGRIIADNICGGDSRYLGSQGSSVIKVFDMIAATTGINETNAKKVRIRGRYSNSFSYESCRLLSWWKSDDHEGGF